MRKWLYFGFGLIILCILGYFGFKLVFWFWGSIKEIDSTVGAAIIASAATIISSVFIASYNSRKAKERVAFEAHREKKAEIYNNFLDMVVRVIRNTKDGKTGDEALPNNLEDFSLSSLPI